MDKRLVFHDLKLMLWLWIVLGIILILTSYFQSYYLVSSNEKEIAQGFIKGLLSISLLLIIVFHFFYFIYLNVIHGVITTLPVSSNRLSRSSWFQVVPFFTLFITFCCGIGYYAFKIYNKEQMDFFNHIVWIFFAAMFLSGSYFFIWGFFIGNMNKKKNREETPWYLDFIFITGIIILSILMIYILMAIRPYSSLRIFLYVFAALIGILSYLSAPFVLGWALKDTSIYSVSESYSQEKAVVIPIQNTSYSKMNGNTQINVLEDRKGLRLRSFHINPFDAFLSSPWGNYAIITIIYLLVFLVSPLKKINPVILLFVLGLLFPWLYSLPIINTLPISKGKIFLHYLVHIAMIFSIPSMILFLRLLDSSWFEWKMNFSFLHTVMFFTGVFVFLSSLVIRWRVNDGLFFIIVIFLAPFMASCPIKFLTPYNVLLELFMDAILILLGIVWAWYILTRRIEPYQKRKFFFERRR